MLADVSDHLEPEVRQRAHREWDALAAQPVDQLGVLDRRVAVIDPLPSELQALPHVLRRPLLAGVADPVLAELPGPRVDLAELRGWMVAFGGIEADADPAIAERQGVLERVHGLV